MAKTITMDMKCLTELISNAIAYGNNDLSDSSVTQLFYENVSTEFITRQLKVGNIPEFKESE